MARKVRIAEKWGLTQGQGIEKQEAAISKAIQGIVDESIDFVLSDLVRGAKDFSVPGEVAKAARVVLDYLREPA